MQQHSFWKSIVQLACLFLDNILNSIHCADLAAHITDSSVSPDGFQKSLASVLVLAYGLFKFLQSLKFGTPRIYLNHAGA